MAKKTTPKVEAQINGVAVELAAEFLPCAQCGYPSDCARAAKCIRGFK
jgi:hypothetical protein